MWIRMISFAGIAGAVLGLLPGQLASQETTPLRERMFQSPTPAVLERLPGDRIETLTLPVMEPHIQMASPWKQDSETGASYRSGELLVKFKEGTGASAKAAALRSSGANRVMKVLPEAWELVELTERTEVQDALVAMRTNDNVEAASLNYRATALQRRPNDEFFSMQWNFDTLQLPLAWEINAGASSAVTVAVVDTGLNTATDTVVFGTQFGQIATRFAAVPDLVNNTNIVRPYDFVWRDAFPVDFAGHGTHVAGTIAQTTNNNTGFAGVAYNVRIMPVKVLAEQGSWDDLLYPCPVGFIGCHRGGTYEVIAEGIRYAADSGAHVINLSLGGTGPAPIVRDAIQYAVRRGAFVAMAAGNSGDTGNPREYPAAYGAEIDGAMTVGAINRALRPVDLIRIGGQVD